MKSIREKEHRFRRFSTDFTDMISIIIPFYNEEQSLPILIDRLVKVCKKINKEYEIILLDDGSTDAKRQNYQLPITNYQLIHHRKRLGKGRALLTGYKAAKGGVIVFMDADLQNDPDDLPKFLEKIDEGYELVNGWRRDRKDTFLKTAPSAIFNFFLLRLLLKSKFHDINCGFKAMKRTVLEKIPLYGDNYRFLPIIADQEGFKTTEIIVSHQQRLYGKSKYGIIRLLFGLFDTLTTYFVYKFSEKPLHFFGPVGGSFFLLGFSMSLYLAFERLFFHVLLYRRPALLFGVSLIIVGVQIIMTGIIGELIVYLNKKAKES